MDHLIGISQLLKLTLLFPVERLGLFQLSYRKLLPYLDYYSGRTLYLLKLFGIRLLNNQPICKHHPQFPSRIQSFSQIFDVCKAKMFQIFVISNHYPYLSKQISRVNHYIFVNQQNTQRMEPQSNSPQKKKRLYLRISSQTSTEPIQKLFDYDHRDKLVNDSCDITVRNKFVALYRKQQTSELKVIEQEKLKVQQMKGFLFLFCIEIIIVNKKVNVKFYPVEKLSKMIKFQQQLESQKAYRELFFVVRSFKDKNNFNTGYKLAVGQTIKLGISQFKVNSLKIQPDGIIYEIPASYSFYDNYRVHYCDRYPDNNQYSCKYCYESLQTQDNFLMNPCKCSGSAKAVHFQCLKPWIELRVKKQKIGQVIQYNFDRFQCEICKAELPRFIIMNGKTYDLLFINKEQEGNFLILQQTNKEVNRVLAISNINKNGYLIGRNQQCTILLTQNTVSRLHAQIKKQGDQFRLFDTKSKFGTLIKQQEMSFELDFAPKMVQIGKTTIQFSLVKKDL